MEMQKAKRVFLLVFVVLVLTSLLASVHSAIDSVATKNGDSEGESKNPILVAWDFLKDAYLGISKDIDIQKIKSGQDEAALAYARLLFFFLVFIVLSVALSHYSASRGISIGVPIIVSLMSSVVVPAGLLATIFATYSAVFTFLALFLPIVGMFLFGRRVREIIGEGIAGDVVQIVIYLMIILLAVAAKNGWWPSWL